MASAVKSRTEKIRFVGGPYHNRVTETNILHAIRVVERTEPLCTPTSYTEIRNSFRASSYLYFRFFTEEGAIYSQYVHESLIKNGDPISVTHEEPTNFPTLDEAFFLTQFLAPLIRAYKRRWRRSCPPTNSDS